MKKVLSVGLALLLIFSMFLMFSSKVIAQGAPEQLTANPYKDGNHSWSADGMQIAYTAFSDSWHRHIWVMNSDGSGKTQLTFGSTVDQYPVFSPDKTKIAFARWGLRGDRFDLMLMNADGTGIIQRLTDGGIPGMVQGTYEELQWSKDGSKLLFSYGEGTTGQYKPWWVCTVDFVAGDIDEGDIDVLARGFNPMFCYDDTKILFTHSIDPYFGDMRIAMMNVDGTGLDDYLSDGPVDYEPDMSPLTNQIVFTRGWEVGDLYLMDADGLNLDLLLSNGLRNYEVCWSPDGKYIAYTSGIIGVDYDIWKIHVQLRVDGIETIVTFESYLISHSWPFRGFSIQQNFWIKGGDQRYWAQNVVLVLGPGKPVSLMIGLFEIYNYTLPEDGTPVIKWTERPRIGWGVDTVTMNSVIEGDQLVMTNDFSSYSWEIPVEALEDCRIDTSIEPKDYRPEIVLVGPFGWQTPFGPIAGYVDFAYPTKGHVNTYLRIDNSGIWIDGVNSVIAAPEDSSTSEWSLFLNWESTGDFEYVWPGPSDQGLKFAPI